MRIIDIMKVFGFCIVFLMVVTTFTFFSLSTTTDPSWFSYLFGTKCADETTPIVVSRKLKENFNNNKSNEKGGRGDRENLEDYNPADPTPGSDNKDVNPGPIEHETPPGD
ncbi:unnamed protein product [Lathyrus oleraceus]